MSGGVGTDKFLTIKNDGIEQGYNTDAPLEPDAQNPTRVFRLSRIPSVNVGGITYKEFVLDVSQTNTNPSIALNDLQLYASPISTLQGHDPVTKTLGTGVAAESPLYDMDRLEDNTILLDGSGSGTGDMFLLVPESAFDGHGTNPFVYLYSRFGEGAGFAANNGAEVWSATTHSNYPRADLGVTKSDFSATAVPGTSVEYTITVTNHGPTAISSFTFSDVIPPEMQLGTVTFTSTPGILHVSLDPVKPRTYSGFWDGAILETGGSVIITLTGMVDPLATGTMTNTVSVFTPPEAADPNLANNTASDEDTLTPTVNLSITKDDGSPTAVPGTPVTYDVTISNSGPSTVTSVHLADVFTPALANLTGTLPPGVSFDLGTGILSGIVLGTGDSIAFKLTGDIPSSATGTLTNTITVTPLPGVIGDPKTAVDVDILTPQVDLSLRKFDEKDQVVRGESLIYNIELFNHGPSDLIGATIFDDLESLSNFLSAFPWELISSSGGATATPASSGGVSKNLVATLDMPSGSSLLFQVTKVISLTAPFSSFTNTVTVDSPVGTFSASDTDTVVPSAGTNVDLSIEKFPPAGPAVPGSTVTYTITVHNLDPSVTVNAAPVVDLFQNSPIAFTALGWEATGSTGEASSFRGSGIGELNDFANLPPLSSLTYTITGTINGAYRNDLVNDALVSTPPGFNDPHTENNSAQNVVSLQAEAVLDVTKSHSPNPAVPGQSVDFTIDVVNNGPSTIFSMKLTDVLPAGFTLAGAFVPSTGLYDLSTGVWEGLMLDTTDHALMTFTANIDPAATGTAINTVTVEPIGAIGPVDQFDDPVDLIPQVALAVTKVDDQEAEVIPGGKPITYTIVVSNGGPSTAHDVVVTDPLPAGIIAFRWSGNGHHNVVGELNDTIASLAPNHSVTYILTAATDPEATGTLVNTVTASAHGTTVSASDEDRLLPTADLRVRKRANRSVAIRGGSLVYYITVSNLGPSSVTGFKLTDTLPSGFTPTSYTTSAGVYDRTTRLWTGLNLAKGQSVTLRVIGRVATTALGPLVNSVRVNPAFDLADPNLRNNFATLTVRIPAPSKRWFF